MRTLLRFRFCRDTFNINFYATFKNNVIGDKKKNCANFQE